MSRGFVREDDQEETPLVTPRASLPDGIDNYVTANGLNELEEEQDLLKKELKTLIDQSSEVNRVQINYISAKLNLLLERLNSARLIEMSSQVQYKILFGATVTLFKEKEKSHCQYQIVGVDEANFSKNKISFLSSLAKALINEKVGDSILLKTPKGERIIKVEAIDYL